MDAVVVHIDMDAFFASVEQRDVPSIRNRPVIVGETRGTRGVVATASYEARKYGIHAAMPMKTAENLCSHAVFVQGSIDKYVDASLSIFNLCLEYCASVDIVSVDEAFLTYHDVWDSVTEKATCLQKRIQGLTGLSASVGIGPNRMLAKLASSLDKPRGFTPLPEQGLPQSIASVPVSEISGIGTKTTALFSTFGIHTIEELFSANGTILDLCLGHRAHEFLRLLRGGQDPPPQRIKDHSLGHEFTFPHDVKPGREFWVTVRRLCDQVSRRLRQQHLQGTVVRVKLRGNRFETRSRERAVTGDMQNPFMLYRMTEGLLCILTTNYERIRLVGVSAAGLYDAVQPDFTHLLFPGIHREKKLISALDAVWDRYGEQSLIRGGFLSGIDERELMNDE